MTGGPDLTFNGVFDAFVAKIDFTEPPVGHCDDLIAPVSW